jgi:glycosyltransferase involved in cell wall biosynthesis
LHILHVTDLAPGVPGGREVHVRRFADESARTGHHNSITSAERLLAGEAPVDALTGVVTSEDADLAVLHSRTSWQSARAIAERLPVVAWVHDQSFVCPASISWYRKTGAACSLPLGPWCVTRAYTHHCNARRPDRNLANVRAVGRTLADVPALRAVIVASRYMADRLAAGRVPREMIRVLPYFVRPPVSPPEPARETPTRVLYIGRLNETKGVEVLISAMAQLPEDYELQIAGDGYALEALKEHARCVGLGEHRVTFTGFLRDDAEIQAAYAGAAVVAIPSLWPEPFGIVGLEALGHGKPVVASRVGGIPEWMHDAEFGYLVRPNDPAQLASKLLALLREPARREEWGRRGREHVQERYSWEQHWSGFQDIAHAVMAE